MKIPFDKIAEKVAALGVPGLVLVVVISTTGLVGGAAIVSALAALGGPFGMMGGLAMLGVLVLISGALARYGIDALMKSVLERMKEKGVTKDEILRTIEGYWFLSRNLKQKLRGYGEEWYPKAGEGGSPV